MNGKWTCAVVLAATFSLPDASQAVIVFNLSSSTDLSNLTVGQNVAIDVGLSGLPSGETFEYLAASVMFDSNVFSAPIVIPALVPDGIVPDSDGFLGLSFPGTADGSYDSLFSTTNALITDNGRFYSFNITVQNAGSGLISFGFVDSIGTPLDMAMPGDPLSYTATASAVPEPSSMALFLCGAAFAALWRLRPKVLRGGSE